MEIALLIGAVIVVAGGSFTLLTGHTKTGIGLINDERKAAFFQVIYSIGLLYPLSPSGRISARQCASRTS